MKRCFRTLLTVLVVSALAVPAASAQDEAEDSGDRPNIVLIISDDQAWSDHGFMGHPHIRTPHIDRLAARGLTFTRGYVAAPLCRPSLASIATGLYPHQHGVTGNDPAFAFDGRRYDPEWRIERGRRNEAVVDLFRGQAALPHLLAAAGYVSFQTGKWWEGSWKEGGFTGGMTHGDPARGGRHGDDGLDIGRQGLQPIVDFIDDAQRRDRPFFLWYAPFLPHSPHTPPDSLLQKYLPSAPSEPVAKYWAMCEWFDLTVGELLDTLERRGLTENTLVVYVVDNGWVQDSERTNRYREPSKQSPYDTGIRTPIMYVWPGRIEVETDTTTLASSTDIAPTVLRAAGLRPEPGMAGVNVLDARARAERMTVYSEDFSHDMVDLNEPARSLEHRVILRGPWKLIVAPDTPRQAGRTELYHIPSDPYETRDVAAEHPDVARALRAALDAWWTP